MIDPAALLILRLAFVLLFAGAVIVKVMRPGSFRVVLDDYQLLPGRAVPAAFLLLVVAETGLTASWLVGTNLPLTAVASVGLLTLYAGAIGINLLRGRTHISCGCSLGQADLLSWGLVARNGVLAATALGAALPMVDRSLGGVDYLVVGLALIVVALLYMAAQQLIANRAAIVDWQRS